VTRIKKALVFTHMLKSRWQSRNTSSTTLCAVLWICWL